MPTAEEILRLHASGLSYEIVAQRFGISPGLAYMIATGLPADGSDTLTAADRDRPGFVPTSTQHLANPASPENPTTNSTVAQWVKQRARSDPAMTRVAAQRNAEPGQINDPDDEHDVFTVLGRDHNQVTAMLKQLETIPGFRKGGSRAQMSRRKSITDMITVALSRHESVEEEWFWPAVREMLPGGDHLAAQALEQEQQGKDTLTALGKLDGDTDEFDGLVEELVARLRKHVAFEDMVFLELRGAMPQRDQDKLGKKLRRGEAVAPTRPHPHAPKRPATAVKVAGATAAVLDKVRDAVAERPADRQGRAD